MADAEFHDSTYEDLDRLVISLARRICKEYKLSWQEYGEDLSQSGWIGVIKARNRYQSQGYKFTSYAYWFANGDIRKEAVRISKRIQGISSLADFEQELIVDNNIDDAIIYKELLNSTDGLELLADELALRDTSKQGAEIRKEQRHKLKSTVNEMKKC